ncbi:T9SS type A sorting domain-containing protein [Flavobacterium psychrotolerans]|uniref:Uncharacterized protein n=1 Tax=Flavobacterium psychrotolerans TaxID=2169410 RepID=A0A2U1JM85_9FLAO|nr:T9SS type A sorting domain-containing protein [Flavobacterium psychrotolerans]PWA06115.1 hypothetical protein DB895_04220 [Flavobacterium psychrotolerans]
MKKTFLLILFILKSTLIFAVNYYVDKVKGNDANNGLTLSTPWKTIQKAALTAQAGSTIFIKAGTYNENIIVTNSGTAGNPIVFRNFNTDLVYIDGTGTSKADGTALIKVYDASYLEFRNLILQNLLCPNATGFIVLNSPSIGITDIKVVNLTIHDIKWTPLSTTQPTSSLENAHPFVVNGSGTTQETAITNITVEECKIYNNVTGYSESLTHNGNVDGFSVINNSVRDNSNIGIDVAGNYGQSAVPSLDHARNGIIKNNKIYNNINPNSSSAGIYIDGGWNITVEKNESFNNSLGIEIGCEKNGTTENIVVKNNIFYNNLNCGIYLGGYNLNTTGQVKNATIRNNSFFQNDTNNGGNGEIQITKATNCKIENNIFYATNQKIILSYAKGLNPNPSNTFDYNCWFTPNNDSNDLKIVVPPNTIYTNFFSYVSATKQDVHSFYSSPNIANNILTSLNMSLNSKSPCINSGNKSTAISPNETDFLGSNRILGSIDIGAIESQIPLGIAPFYNENETQLFPNPVSDFFHIESKKGIQNIRVYSEMGVLVLNIDHPLTIETLDVSNLSSGVYILKVNYEDEISSNHKIIKN